MGNEYTGNLDLLAEFVEIKEVNDNWITGIYKDYNLSIKCFAGNSGYGIEGGRISKLWIRKKGEIKPCLNYDRGWDIRPADKTTKNLLKKLLEALQ